ncbi:hypothetical protein HHX47_DHR7000743 [Lentinula edodes]|nr:hypothetical protein HHX47_DHR7000743 [Lentinula edodes]
MPLPEAFEVPQLDATNQSFPSYRPYVDDRSLQPLKAREATNDQCVDLTLAQAKTSMCMISLHFFKALISCAVPNFWQKVQSYADGRYGKGSRKILMYDKHEAVRSCTLQGIGEIPFIASGKFWIEYDDKTYDHLVNEKTHDDHYKFEVDFKDVLPAASQRTIKAFFKGSFSTSSHGNYSAVCTGGSG